jgi:hypothetical protein
MGLWGVARSNTSVSVSPETFLLLLLHPHRQLQGATCCARLVRWHNPQSGAPTVRAATGLLPHKPRTILCPTPPRAWPHMTPRATRLQARNVTERGPPTWDAAGSLHARHTAIMAARSRWLSLLHVFFRPVSTLPTASHRATSCGARHSSHAA